MVERKIYCDVVEGAVYEDRCLFKLSKILEGNKSCENCILRELEKIKSGGSKRTYSTAEKRIRPGSKGRCRIKKNIASTYLPKIPEGEAEPIKDAAQITKQSYSVRDLVNLLGKPERTIRKWAEKGKIPAHKVGREWRFPKEEINCWFPERKGDAFETPETEDQQESPMPLAQSLGNADPEPME